VLHCAWSALLLRMRSRQQRAAGVCCCECLHFANGSEAVLFDLVDQLLPGLRRGSGAYAWPRTGLGAESRSRARVQVLIIPRATPVPSVGRTRLRP
jgi:hypothetical protein